MGAPSYRAAGNAALITLAASSLATPALAAETSTINAADTAWMIVATALVLMMTIPGLAPVSYTHLTLPTIYSV